MATGASIGLPAEDRTRGVGGRHGQMRPGPGRSSPGRKNRRACSLRRHRRDCAEIGVGWQRNATTEPSAAVAYLGRYRHRLWELAAQHPEVPKDRALARPEWGQFYQVDHSHPSMARARWRSPNTGALLRMADGASCHFDEVRSWLEAASSRTPAHAGNVVIMIPGQERCVGESGQSSKRG